MKKKIFRYILLSLLLFSQIDAFAWGGMAMPRLHVEGRYFKDNNGNIVNLHGFAQTYSPYFNEGGKYWTDYNVDGCLSYNQGLIDDIMNVGWKMSFMRLHMDPYWSNTPGATVTGENDISAFDFERFKTYLNSVFIPMAEYAISKGLYVIMRPPGVCPEDICVNDDYNKYLNKVWSYVSQQPKIKNNPNIIFELANEPVNIKNSDGTSASFKELKQYFQSVVDTIRVNCDNIILVPGLGYQANFAGFADYPVEGDNIGYAVHCYPGWYNSGSETTPTVTYDAFKAGWDKQITPVSDFAPIVVTEMDWAPAKYDSSWGKGITGVAGGTGFGANFKKIADDAGNTSYLIFTTPDKLAKFEDVAATANDTTFLNDPNACVWPAYHWYQDYAKVDYPHTDFSRLPVSDNGDGTFTNPVIQGDFPDPDVIKVGDTYYMVTTTMHNFPGCTLLKSKDLVNWEYCCNPLTKMSSYAEYNLEDGKNIYAKGSWANSLIYKNGTFYIMFNAFGNSDDGGGYLLSATDPEGTWTMKRLSRGYYDPGMMVDDDGTVYVVYGNSNIYVAKLDDNFNFVSETKVISDFSGLEGNHMFKKDGYYYIYSTYAAWPAQQWCFRSTSVFGTYEQKKVFDSDDIHQGAMIKTQSGEWWTMLMRDCGAFGRMPYLLSVTWKSNWPVIGTNGADAGTYTKPNVGSGNSPKYLPTNDPFKDVKLGMQWQWNHNPDNTKFSLLERSGYLRLYTASVTDSLQKARNTLTQRIYGYHDSNVDSYGTVCLDVRNMKDGDMAGLTVFQDPYAFIGVYKDGSSLKLVQRSTQTGSADQSQEISCDSIYLRAVANIGTSKTTFYYSTDNNTYTQFGNILDMQYNLSVFVGNRFGIFNYATKSEGGYVDVSWFSTEPTFNEYTYYSGSVESYSEDYLTATSVTIEKDSYSLLIGSGKTLSITATYKDGHTADIASEMKYSIANGNIVKVTNGRLSSLKEGSTTVTGTYTDPMGKVFTVTFDVIVSMFPLTTEGFDPDIYNDGTFTQSSHTFKTAQYGFGGWNYSNSIDLTPYNYLIVNLATTQNCNAQVRIFDESSYWSACSESSFSTSSKQLKIDLKSLKGNDGVALDLSHVYMIGFWFGNAGSIKIAKVFLSNDGSTEVDTGVSSVVVSDDDLVDVYNVSGMRVLTQVKRADVKFLLTKGVYIVDKKCMVIK